LHHLNFDGSGYVGGFVDPASGAFPTGEAIPMEARVFRVADSIAPMQEKMLGNYSAQLRRLGACGLE
jgi:response regulator RpfG family c-di-GMP phosphodiesterase